MSDVTKMTVEELYNLVHDFPRSLESDNAWPEILRRLKRLEKCEALNKYAQHHPKCAFLESTIGNGKAVPCSCGYDAARAALEK